MSNKSKVPDWLKVSAEVAETLGRGGAVVALESTVIAHGLPRPQNLEVARALEADVRAGGATPATVAVIAGRPTVGLTPDELTLIAEEEGVEKLSTREIPLAMARGDSGGTTVAATASLAARAGVQVFATGGIGGVHRGTPPDISADLLELPRSKLIVVCAGAKSILDIPATRELLETLGVLVLGWRTDRFPAFYTRGGDVGVDARVDTAEKVGEVWRSHITTDAEGAILLCAPIPKKAALDDREVEALIESALSDGESKGITGKNLTPYLLRALADATDGATLEANIALLRNNVTVAAKVASVLGGGNER